MRVESDPECTFLASSACRVLNMVRRQRKYVDWIIRINDENMIKERGEAE